MNYLELNPTELKTIKGQLASEIQKELEAQGITSRLEMVTALRKRLSEDTTSYSPLLKIIPAVEGEVIDSESFNLMMRAIIKELEGLFVWSATLDKLLFVEKDVYAQEVQKVKSQLISIQEEIDRLSYISQNTDGYGDALHYTFDGNSFASESDISYRDTVKGLLLNRNFSGPNRPPIYIIDTSLSSLLNRESTWGQANVNNNTALINGATLVLVLKYNSSVDINYLLIETNAIISKVETYNENVFTELDTNIIDNKYVYFDAINTKQIRVTLVQQSLTNNIYNFTTTKIEPKYLVYKKTDNKFVGSSKTTENGVGKIAFQSTETHIYEPRLDLLDPINEKSSSFVYSLSLKRKNGSEDIKVLPINTTVIEREKLTISSNDTSSTAILNHRVHSSIRYILDGTITVADNTAITGTTLSFGLDGITDTLTVGTEFAAGATTDDTATNLAAYLNTAYPSLTASPSTDIVTVSASSDHYITDIDTSSTTNWTITATECYSLEEADVKIYQNNIELLRGRDWEFYYEYSEAHPLHISTTSNDATSGKTTISLLSYNNSNIYSADYIPVFIVEESNNFYYTNGGYFEEEEEGASDHSIIVLPDCSLEFLTEEKQAVENFCVKIDIHSHSADNLKSPLITDLIVPFAEPNSSKFLEIP